MCSAPGSQADTLKGGGRDLDFLPCDGPPSPFHCVAKGTTLQLHFATCALSFGETQAV